MKSFPVLAAVFLLLAAPVLAAWPTKKFTEVRAFAYNLDGLSRSQSIIVNKKLNPTVVNPAGVLLTKDQTAKLLAALNGKHPSHPVANCFIPRHAFVFYRHTKVVAVVDICFECLGAESVPEGISQPNDLPSLAELCGELQLAKSPGPGFRKHMEDLRKSRE